MNKEEYLKLSENERNQLALDRYVSGHRKTKWQIGRDYEMYCAYLYRNKGWFVDMFGIEKRLDDMGRDLIAHKWKKFHVIQCKLWSKDKTIYEKHIAQLYGSAIEFSLMLEDTPFFHAMFLPYFSQI